MGRHHVWIKEELDIVRRDYDGTGACAARMANRLGVTFHAVKGRVQVLGVCHNTNQRAWTPEEEERLATLITKYCPRRVAKMMKRSMNSVVVKSKRLRLSRRARDGWFTKTEVCEILGVDHHWIQHRIDRGELKANWHNGVKPQQNGGACWHILTGDLRRFIIEHSLELTGRNIDLGTLVYILS